MSENFDKLGELGDKIKKIIDTAVSTKDYRQMTEDIKQTVGQTVNSAVNSAVDSGSEAIKNGLNNVFGTGNSQSGDSGVYRNKTKEFEEKRRREREQEQERQRIEKEKKLSNLIIVASPFGSIEFFQWDWIPDINIFLCTYNDFTVTVDDPQYSILKIGNCT